MRARNFHPFVCAKEKGITEKERFVRECLARWLNAQHRNNAMIMASILLCCCCRCYALCITIIIATATLSYQFIFDALFIYVVFGSLFQSLAFDRFGAIFRTRFFAIFMVQNLIVIHWHDDSNDVFPFLFVPLVHGLGSFQFNQIQRTQHKTNMYPLMWRMRLQFAPTVFSRSQ